MEKKGAETFILGQPYHMNLSFVSGPNNLEDVLASINCPKLTVIEVTTRQL